MTIAPPLQGIVDLGVDTLWLTQSHLDGVDDGHLVEGLAQSEFRPGDRTISGGDQTQRLCAAQHLSTTPPLRNNALRQVQEIVPGLTLIACEIINPTVGER